jgi:uncharacterized protein (DUF1800 family)
MPSVSTYSLAPKGGKLNQEDLLHLLRRSLFGVGHAELLHFHGKTADECMLSLLKQSPLPDKLIQDDPDISDNQVPKGTEWINAPYEDENIDKKRRIYLKGWWVGQILNRDYSLTEKMRLFWHNHFVTEMDIVKDSRYSYRYVVMLRDHALGNFKTLIRQGTTNIAMLAYLNGNNNGKAAPNENYARELMELFTLGKQNNPNYTEDDVKVAARVLTGWKDDKERIAVVFDAAQHDTSDKKFSAFFDNHVIKGRADGAAEIDELTDMIFGKIETARFVCRNLYRWFVTSHIDENIERDIITPLARVFMDHNFEIKPVLHTLLCSEHFYDNAFRGCIVKSPVDYLAGLSKQFAIVLPSDLSQYYLCWINYYYDMEGLSMNIGDPPSVAGWPAYYQAPKFYQWWINSYTLGLRKKLIDNFSSLEGLNCNGPKVRIDLLSFVDRFENPGDINALVDDCLKMLMAFGAGAGIREKLKAILLSGQKSDKYWSDAWAHYKSKPDDKEAKEVLETRLKSFIKAICGLPEYHVM